MATFSKKMMGKEVGDASVYAEPHHMTGKKFTISDNPGKEANSSKLDTMDVSKLINSIALLYNLVPSRFEKSPLIDIDILDSQNVD
jgi:hypothetical protein